MKCDSCGTESDFDAAFVKQPGPVGRPAKNLCPACWVKQRNNRHAWFLPSLILGALGGYLIEQLRPDSDMGPLAMNVCIAGLFVVLTIVPHELGHVAAARLLGWRVHQVVIGVGKSLWKRRWFGILFDVRTIPVAGATWIAPDDIDSYRLKRFLSIAAGPAVNAGLALGVVLIAQGNLSGLDFEALPRWAQLFLVANLFVLFINLWPHQPKSGFDLPTDGKQLLQLISFSKKSKDQVHAQRFMMEAMIARERSDLAGARLWAEQGLALYPEDLKLLDILGIVHLDEGKYEQARAIFLNLLKIEKQPPAMRFLYSNNVAYADALSENPELLPEADAYSKNAYAGLPWMAAVTGTRGTVLIAMGNYDEGMELLKRSMEDAHSARDKAENACHMAVALTKTGRRDEARKYFELARGLDSKCPLLNRTERALKPDSVCDQKFTQPIQ